MLMISTKISNRLYYYKSKFLLINLTYLYSLFYVITILYINCLQILNKERI